MVLKTALCFLLAGVALLTLGMGRTLAGRGCGVTITVIAGLTLFAYLTNPGLEIDSLAGPTLAGPGEAVPPLRMAPNTATAFLLVGLALALTGGRRAFAAGGAAGIVVLSLSLVALVGYLFGIQPAFGWGRMIAMSPQSAVGLGVVGFAIVAVVGRPDLAVGRHRNGWLAFLVGAAGATTTLLLWQALAADHSRVSQQPSYLPVGALCGGLLFSGLLAWSVLRTGVARLLHDDLLKEMAERRVAEQERDRFFSLSIDMLCISSGDGYFKRLNPAFEQTLGYTVEELTGRPFVDFVHPDDVAATLAEVDKQLLEGLPAIHFENRYRCKDGTYRWLAWTSMPDVASGMMYALARDVTKNKATETERERLIAELTMSLAQVRTLSEMLPMCSACRRLRDDVDGTWNPLEQYLSKKSGTQVSHSICPECMRRLYPEHAGRVEARLRREKS
jgi:PAS domain S-box-containing protein